MQVGISAKDLKAWYDAFTESIMSVDECVSECAWTCLQIDEQQVNKQLEEIRCIIEMRKKMNTAFPVSHSHSLSNISY